MYPHSITIFHKNYDKATDKETYERQVVDGVYWYGSKKVSIQGLGVVNSDSITICIPSENIPTIGLKIAKKDIVVLGKIETEITSISELSNYEDKITVSSIDNNTIGSLVDNILIVGE